MKFTPGILAGELRGSAGNTTASRNRYGAYFTRRTAGVDPETDHQSEQRARFADAVAEWAALDADRREAWNAFANNYEFTDSRGEAYRLSGQAMWVKVATIRQSIGLGFLSTIPVPSVVRPPELISASIGDVDDFELTVEYELLPDNSWLFISVTDFLSTGRKFIRPSEPRLITRLQAPVADWTLETAFDAYFGHGTVAPAVYGLRVLPVSAEGFPGTPVFNSLLLTS